MFPIWQIANSAFIAAVVSSTVLTLWHIRSRTHVIWDVVVPILITGLSVLIWRSVGNVAQLNVGNCSTCLGLNLLCAPGTG